MVATTSSANTTRTRGRAMRCGKLVERAVARMRRMRVQLIDPSADVLPYDHALAGALARRGADVELVTSRFVHGPAPAPDGYAVSESFYRAGHPPRRRGAPRLRRALSSPSTCPDMLRERRRGARADLAPLAVAAGSRRSSAPPAAARRARRC